jgi:hypothetical protein
MIPKPHIWNRGALAVSFACQLPNYVDGKDGNPTYFDPTTCRRRLDAWFSVSLMCAMWEFSYIEQ